MTRQKATFLLLFAAAAALSVLSWRQFPQDLPYPSDADLVERWFLAGWIVLAMPFAFWMPFARVRFFAPLAKVPSQTYVLPASLICLTIPLLAGEALGLLIVALTEGGNTQWFFGACVLVLIPFSAGTHRRLRQTREFEMPIWPPGLMIRWGLRGFGWRLRG